MSNLGSIAPWYILERKIRGTYGKSEFVDVGNLVELSSGYLLNINVSLDFVAKALRAVLPETYTIGNIVVNVVIYDSKGNAVPISDITYTTESLAKTVCSALYMNPLFVGAVIKKQVEGNTDDLLGDIVALIEPEVVQFPDGSLNNICHTFSEVASTVFNEISNLAYTTDLSLAFNDFSKNCNVSHNIYCPGNSKKPCGEKREIPCWQKKESQCDQNKPCWKKEENEKNNWNINDIFGEGYNKCHFR